MPARFNDVMVTITAQSQAVMAISGGGEVVDTPLSGQPPASGKLTSRMQADMAGVTCVTNGAQLQTAVGGTPLIRSYNNGNDAFWHDGNQALDVWGVTTRNYMVTRASASRMMVMCHWTHSQDADFSGWSDSYYGANLRSYYSTMFAECNSSFGQFYILPVVLGSRQTGNEARLVSMRKIYEALAGVGPVFAGVNPLSYVLPPVHPGCNVPNGPYVGSGDFIHVIRSTAWRLATVAAVRVSGWNGFPTAAIDQPRLARAKLINSNTLRAYIVSPAGFNIVKQGSNPGFSLTAGGVSSVGAINNSAVGTTKYATVDMTVSGVVSSSRLIYATGNGQYTAYVNGSTPPRGQFTRALFADPTNSGLTITDGAEDVLRPEAVLHVAPNETGVPVET